MSLFFHQFLGKNFFKSRTGVQVVSFIGVRNFLKIKFRLKNFPSPIKTTFLSRFVFYHRFFPNFSFSIFFWKKIWNLFCNSTEFEYLLEHFLKKNPPFPIKKHF